MEKLRDKSAKAFNLSTDSAEAMVLCTRFRYRPDLDQNHTMCN